jgi:hypothetical protein
MDTGRPAGGTVMTRIAQYMQRRAELDQRRYHRHRPTRARLTQPSDRNRHDRQSAPATKADRHPPSAGLRVIDGAHRADCRIKSCISTLNRISVYYSVE